MKIRVLGCGGGIGGGARTASFLVDDDILIDAGTGTADLDLPALRSIDHVFLTHSHLDHVTALPLLVDTVCDKRSTPVTVHALEATLAALRRHIFNGEIWPDFTRIPDPQNPYLLLKALAAGDETVIGGRRFRSIKVEHAVPAVGYLVTGGNGSLAYTGDMAETAAFWGAVNGCADLKYLIIETTFMDRDEDLSRLARHLCPKTLAGELGKLKARPDIYITHLMPGREDDIMREIAHHIPDNTPRRLERGQVFEL